MHLTQRMAKHTHLIDKLVTDTKWRNQWVKYYKSLLTDEELTFQFNTITSTFMTHKKQITFGGIENEKATNKQIKTYAYELYMITLDRWAKKLPPGDD